MTYSNFLNIPERDLGLEKRPVLTCMRTEAVDELEPVVWWCAMLQALEYPTHNMVLHTYFKSDSPKNVPA